MEEVRARFWPVGERKEEGKANPESFRGQKPAESSLRAILIASRLWEAALLFDNKEARNLGDQERKVF